MNTSYRNLRFAIAESAKRTLALAYSREMDVAARETSESFWKTQGTALARMVTFATESVPYYQSLRSNYLDCLSSRLDVRMALSAMPILSKETVRRRNADFFSRVRPYATEHRTSGSTGTPLKLRASPLERAFNRAAFDWWLRRIQGNRERRMVLLAGFLLPGIDGPFYRCPLTNTLFISIYALAPQFRTEIRSALEAFRPSCVYGYASALRQLVDLVGEWRGARSAVAVTTSEVMRPDWSERIGSVMGSKPFELYSSQEGAHMVIQCHARRLHIHPCIGIVEILDEDNKPVPRGGAGRVIVTGLVRRSMPLIRYEIGDMAESTGYEDGCECGLAWPTIGSVAGRADDLVIARDGRRIGLLTFHLTRLQKAIKEAQLVQLEIGVFQMRIVLASDVGPARQMELQREITSELERRLGEPAALSFEFLDVIPRGPNGKFRSVVVENRLLEASLC